MFYYRVADDVSSNPVAVVLWEKRIHFGLYYMRQGRARQPLKTEANMRILYVVALAACTCLVSLPSKAQGKELPQAEVTKINEMTQAFVKAVLAKDWKAVAGLYLDDAVLNPPNQPAVNGRVAIQAWFEKFPPLTAFKCTDVKVEGRGDLAYVLGTYTMTIAPPGAPGPVNDSGKYVDVRRRQKDGRWLIVVDIFNSDMPAAPPQK